MEKVKIERYSLIVNLSGVILAFLGVILVAYAANIHQEKMYRADRSDKRIERKEKLLEEAYRVYGRMNEIKYWQEEAQTTVKDEISAKDWIDKLDQKRNPIISKQFSDLLAINKMIEFHFSFEVGKLIGETFAPNRFNGAWWHIPNKELNSITELMAKEIRESIAANK